MATPLNRIQHAYNGNYTTIGNGPINAACSGKLSSEALGVFLIMWSLPPDWKFHQKNLEKKIHMGRDRLRRIVKELEDTGFLRRRRMAPQEGGGWKWMLSDRKDGFSVTPRSDVFHGDRQNTSHLIIPEGKGLAEGNGVPNPKPSAKEERPQRITNEDSRENSGLHEAENTSLPLLDSQPPPRANGHRKKVPPRFEDLQQFAEEIGLPEREVEICWNHYEANGWRQGKGSGRPIKDWHAAVRNWKLREPEFANADSSGYRAPRI